MFLHMMRNGKNRRCSLMVFYFNVAGFGFLSGFQTKGYMACSSCGPDLADVAKFSKADSKMVYMSHTKYLEENHAYMKDAEYYLDAWSGGDDVRPKPLCKTPAYWKEVWAKVCDPNDPMPYEHSGMVFFTCFHKLEYWSKMPINHLLDPMHIEGNVGKSLVKHLYGEKGMNWLNSCQEYEMHADLWPYVNHEGIVVKPNPTWVLSKQDRMEFRRCIGAMWFPTNYGANLRKAFGEQDLSNWPSYLKTHDWHRLLQHIILVAIIGLGSPELQTKIWKLGKLLRWVCSKTIVRTEIEAMEKFGARVVCELERALTPLIL